MSVNSENEWLTVLATGVDRFRCVYAMSDSLQFYEPQTSLPKLRKCFRSTVLE